MLNPGTRFAAYEVTSLVGAGGMGEVYRARDTKLQRDVALKILPDTLASDRERLARFEREARTLATLNHSHIAQIYGFEYANGTHALVMELVEGEDLAERLARGPVPLDEAIPIARQIAEALAAAHEAGIVHRDLKPANIKVRPDAVVSGQSRDGKDLVFGNPGSETMSVVSFATQPTILLGKPRPVPRTGLLAGIAGPRSPRNWDLAPDGRLIGVVEAGDTQPQIRVVLNWHEELKQRVPN